MEGSKISINEEKDKVLYQKTNFLKNGGNGIQYVLIQ